jgi:hypothetical protein
VLAGVLGVSALLVYHTGDLLDLLASSISSFSGATTTVFFTPYGGETLQPGDSATIDVNVNTRVPINALGATISYPKDSLEIVSISKEKSFFDLWTEDTAIAEEAGEIRFSGGTTKQGGITGTGTVLTLIVRAKTPGVAQLVFKNVQVFPNNASGKAIETQTHALTYTIQKAEALASSGGGSSSQPAASPSLQNPDLNNDGKINLIDLSILTFKMMSGYSPRYDLNANGSVGLDDLSILLSKF